MAHPLNIAALIGTTGGLSGYAAVAWTIWRAKSADRERAIQRLSAVTRLDEAGLYVTLAMEASLADACLAHIALMGPKGAMLYTQEDFNSAVGFSTAGRGPLIIDSGKKALTLEMRVRFGDLHGAIPTLRASFFVSGSAPVPSAYVKVVVTSKARQKRLISRKMALSPTA